MKIFTIGYEATTMGDFIAALKQAGVERVIDVRALPLSRRPGFSKSPLRAALGEEHIDYVHLKALGTPSEGRTAARAGRHAKPPWGSRRSGTRAPEGADASRPREPGPS